MSEFDIKAAGWDHNQMHWDRSAAIVNSLLEQIPVNMDMTAMEFGAGTGITSFLLKDHLKQITMMDNSPEMVRIMNDKVKEAEATNLRAVCFDLEKNSWQGGRFDLIISQMVFHHISNIENIIGKFSRMLNPGGYLAIADLYPEDGSFHGADFTGHRGFDIRELSDLLQKKGFGNISSKKCYVINKKISETDIKQFNVFLLIANRLQINSNLKGN